MWPRSTRYHCFNGEKKNSMCCCYPKEETQAPAVAVIVVVTMSFCRVWLVLVDISLRTRPKLIYNNGGRLLQLPTE